MLIKDQIKKRRTELGMSVAELAKRCKVSETSIRYWEDDRSYPSKRVAPALEVALSFRLDWSEGRHDGHDARFPGAAGSKPQHPPVDVVPRVVMELPPAAPHAPPPAPVPTQAGAPSIPAWITRDIELMLMIQSLPETAKNPLYELVQHLTELHDKTKR